MNFMPTKGAQSLNKWCFGLAMAILLIIAQSGHVLAADMKVTWLPVKQDVTGAKDTISHYLLYLGRTPRPALVTHPGDGTFGYDKTLNAGRNTQHLVSGLVPGTWFFAVSAVDTDGNISDYSKQIKLELPDETGKVPPPILKGNKSTNSIPIEKPEDGCATVQSTDARSLALFLGLIGLALISRRRKVSCP